MEDLDILKSSELLNEVLVSHLDLGYKSKDVKNVFHQTYSEIMFWSYTDKQRTDMEVIMKDAVKKLRCLAIKK